MEALVGAEQSLHKHKPQLIIERIKSSERDIQKFLENIGYQIFPVGLNLIAVHMGDPAIKQIKTI